MTSSRQGKITGYLPRALICIGHFFVYHTYKKVRITYIYVITFYNTQCTITLWWTVILEYENEHKHYHFIGHQSFSHNVVKRYLAFIQLSISRRQCLKVFIWKLLYYTMFNKTLMNSNFGVWLRNTYCMQGLFTIRHFLTSGCLLEFESSDLLYYLF